MFGRDNPGGEWLRNKREMAEDWASRNPRGATGKMISGAVTAYTRKAVMIDLSALAGLRGACDENRRPGDARYDALMLDV